MKKSSNRARKLQYKKKNKPRRNPLWLVKKGSTLGIDIHNDTSGLDDFAIDMMIRSALVGCTVQEKMAIAALIPILIQTVRKLLSTDAPPETEKQP